MSDGATLSTFFAMGGYAFYVWTAYLVAAATIGGMVALTILQWRRACDRLRTLESDGGQAPPKA